MEAGASFHRKPADGMNIMLRDGEELYSLSPKDMFFIGFRKRKGEREREIYVREKLRSVASYIHPYWGSNPQRRHVP